MVWLTFHVTNAWRATLIFLCAGSGLLAEAPDAQVINSVAHYSNNEVWIDRPVTWRTGCGNGKLDEGELFDNGQPWEPSTEYHISCGATCGDGFQHEGEGCDDGNNEDNDGCSRLCQVE